MNDSSSDEESYKPELTQYKYPFVCCDFDPAHLKLSSTSTKHEIHKFSYGAVLEILHEINAKLKLIKPERWSPKYYDKKISELTDNNYSTDQNLLLFLFSRPEIRLSINFDNNHREDAFYTKELKNSNSVALKLVYLFMSCNSKKYKFISFASIDKEFGSCTSIYINFYYEAPNRGRFISNSYYDTLLIAKTILNENSIELLEMSNIDIMRKMLFSSSFNKLNYILEKYNSLPFIDREFIIVKHGFISWALGIRNFEDIDMNVINVYSKEFQTFHNDLKKYINVDIIAAIPGSNYIIRNYQYAFLSQMYLNDPNTYEYILDPSAYGYIFGIKVFNLRWHMTIRYLIGRPKDCSEILYFNETTDNKFPLPDIPEHKLTFSMKEGKSYHTHGMINVIKKYGINDRDEEVFNDAQNYYMEVIKAKSYKFVIPMYWKKNTLFEKYAKYIDRTISDKFNEFVNSWELPDSMIKLDSIQMDELHISTIVPGDVIINNVKRLGIEAKYQSSLTRLYKYLTDETIKINSEVDLANRLASINLDKYESVTFNLKKIEENKPTMPVIPEKLEHPQGLKYALTKEVNNWKTYYDHCDDFIDLIIYNLDIVKCA